MVVWYPFPFPRTADMNVHCVANYSLWQAIGEELCRTEHDGNNRTFNAHTKAVPHALFQELAECLNLRVSENLFDCLVFEHFGDDRSVIHPHYHTRDAYEGRLQDGITSKVDMDLRGRRIDIAIAAVCLQKTIFTVKENGNGLERYEPVIGGHTFLEDFHVVGTGDIVIVDCGDGWYRPRLFRETPWHMAPQGDYRI